MYPSSTPLVPDEQFHQHDFAPRALDADRDFNEQRRRRPPRPTTIRLPSLANGLILSASGFSAAVLIGVGLTLAWQTSPDEINQPVTAWAPPLAALLATPTPTKAGDPAVSAEMAQQIKLIA